MSPAAPQNIYELTLCETLSKARHIPPISTYNNRRMDGRTGWAGIHMCEHWERASTETTDQTRPGTKPQATTTTLSATTTESQPAQAIIRNWLADKHAKWFRGVFCVPGVGTDTSRVTVCPLLDVCVTTDADWFRAQPMNYWQAGSHLVRPLSPASCSSASAISSEGSQQRQRRRRRTT